MRIFIIPALALTLCAAPAHAQKVRRDSTLTLTEMKLTNAPAFSLLDISPSSIETTPSTKKIGIALTNAISQGNGVPQNLAIEVTPFWLKSHRGMTDYKYFGTDSTYRQNKAFSQLKFAAVSLAVINKDSATNIGTIANHNLAFGARATIIKLHSAATLQRLADARRSLYRSQISRLDFLQGRPPTTELLAEYHNRNIDTLTRSSYGDTIQTILQARPLFCLDGAFATNLAFDTGNAGTARVSKTGIWATAQLSIDLTEGQPGTNYFNLYAIGRFINTSDSLDAAGQNVSYNLTDFGGKTEFQFGKVAVAYEYIRRVQQGNSGQATFKSVGIVQYKIRDGLFLTASIGQNFADIHYLNRNITSFGLNWGIGNGAVKLNQ